MANIRAVYINTAGSRKETKDADVTIVGAGVMTASGDLSISPAGTNVTIASGKTLQSGGGAGALDFSAGSGVFKTTTGAVTIGPGAVTVSGAASFSSSATVTGQTNANGGVQRSTSGTLSVGTDANTTALSIGSIGVTATVLGNLQVNGTETVVGTSTFQDSATFEGNVTFGNAATDTVKFVSRVGPSGDQDIHFVKELAHVIDVDASTTAATAGGALTLRSGNGNGAAGGAFAVDTGSGSAGGALSIGATNAASIAIGRSGITTTVTGGLSQATGAVNLTANAASVLSTSAGALNLDGAAGVNLKGGATTAVAINSTGTAITVQAGAVLATTGTGNINLPNNASARFQVEGSAVGSTVTAANLNTVTNGSNADALHVHAVGAPAVTTATAGETISANNVVSIENSGGNPRLFKADANGASPRFNAVGIASAAITSGASGTYQAAGEISVADAVWDALPAVGDVGSLVFVSETAGNLTLTAPTTSGSYVQPIGTVTRGGTGAVKVELRIGESVERA